MGDTLVVLMGTRVAGTIRRLENNLLRFEYDAGYQSSPGATPISLSMPLALNTHADVPARRVVSNFLTGLLPDDTATIKRWADFYKVRTSSPFFLLGTRRAGLCRRDLVLSSGGAARASGARRKYHLAQ